MRYGLCGVCWMKWKTFSALLPKRDINAHLGDAPVEGTLTFTTIGRAAYVEVQVPAMDDHQPVDPLTALAMPIQQTIPDVKP